MRKSYLLLAGAFLGILLAFGTNIYLSSREVVVTLPAEAETFEATPEAKLVTNQTSPDGTKNLYMKVLNGQEGTKTYSFFVESNDSPNDQVIFSRILNLKTMAVPYNAWSPDNQYFFIQEKGDLEESIFIFKSSGEKFDQGERYIDATKLFKEKGINNFHEATGWASENLLIINTKTEEGDQGPSYWFELPSRAIIQLGTQF